MDEASENCPCRLAETGNCLVCSRLQGKNECDCDWTGVCIYNEYILGGRKRAEPRTDQLCTVIRRKELQKGEFILLQIQCRKGLALRCRIPGAHIFIRGQQWESFYDVPLSVLDADEKEGILTVCFRVLSAKTRALAECGQGDTVILRGPYRNGIHGLPGKMKGKKLLFLAGGAGIVPAVHALNLLSSQNPSDLIVSPGTAEIELIQEFLKEEKDCGPRRVLFGEPGSPEYAAALDKVFAEQAYDEILILGSPGFQEAASKEAALRSSAHQSFSNNETMCCGEGVCGACSCQDREGRHIPACKYGGDWKKTTE